jgi:hypothetical protein
MNVFYSNDFFAYARTQAKLGFWSPLYILTSLVLLLCLSSCNDEELDTLYPVQEGEYKVRYQGTPYLVFFKSQDSITWNPDQISGQEPIEYVDIYLKHNLKITKLEEDNFMAWSDSSEVYENRPHVNIIKKAGDSLIILKNNDFGTFDFYFIPSLKGVVQKNGNIEGSIVWINEGYNVNGIENWHHGGNGKVILEKQN